MKVTKLEHACTVVEKGASRIVIDPGTFLAALPEDSSVAAIVVTHEHPDHLSADHIRRLLEKNPDALVLGPQGVADRLASEDEPIHVQAVTAGDTVEAGPFSLRFFGEHHSVIHPSIPVIDNVAVLVDDTYYYAGDSYTVPGVPVALLAAPIGAPWLKIEEAMDFVLAVAPEHAFPVHDMTLSKIGKDMAAARLQWATEQGGGAFAVLEPGESIEL